MHWRLNEDSADSTNPDSAEPTANATAATPQKRKGSVFFEKSHEKDAFAALTENVTGEFVIHILDKFSVF
jgi:hypothetical protein